MGTRTGSFTNRPIDTPISTGRYRQLQNNFLELLIGTRMSGGAVGLHLEWIDEVIAMAGVATIDTVGTIPQGAIVLPGWSRVIAELTGASVSTYIVGIAGATNKFLATGQAVTTGTESLMAAHWAGTVAIVHTAAAAAVRVTPDTSATGGSLRITLPYLCVSAPSA